MPHRSHQTREPRRGTERRIGGNSLRLALLVSLLSGVWASVSAAQGLTVVGVSSSGVVRPGGPSTAYLTLRISNGVLVSDQLTRLRITNLTTGPGTQAERDAEVGSLSLYRDNGDGVYSPYTDVLLATVPLVNGVAAFDPISVSVAVGGSITLHVVGTAPLVARDGDEIHLVVANSSDVSASPVNLFSNSWPVDPNSRFTLDGSVAAQFAVQPISPQTVHAGDSNILALQVRLPADGYSADVLNGLNVVNAGTAAPGADITTIRAWADDGDGVLSPGSDALLGTLSNTGGSWQRSGLAQPIPVGGLVVFVTVDLDPFATAGRTIQLGLPYGALTGSVVASGNDGPLDAVVLNPSALAIGQQDRMVVTEQAGATVPVHPGQRGATLQRLAIGNNYQADHTLMGLTVHSRATGPGTSADLDAQVDFLDLWSDENGNGVIEPSDRLLSTAYFQSGTATFDGLNLAIPAGGVRQLVLTANVSGTATDGDTLATRVEATSDLRFAEPSAVVAAWPLDRGWRQAVDGMVASQVRLRDVDARTIAPGEGPVLGLDLVVPRNGRLDDVLQRIRVQLGSAGAADVGDLHLWADGGDGVFDSGAGDDVDLGSLTVAGADWTSSPLAQPLGIAGRRMFVTLTASAGAADSASVWCRVPLDGIQVASTNDGPIDSVLAAPGGLLVSRSNLLTWLETRPTVVTVGRDFEVLMLARNVGPDSISGITPSALSLQGNGVVSRLTGPVPATPGLRAGGADTVRWTYHAAAAGAVVFSGNAVGTHVAGGQPVASLATGSALHRIYDSATALPFSASSTMPAIVNRGQTGIDPLVLTFDNSASVHASTVELHALRLTLLDGGGRGMVPDSLLDRVSVSSGSQTYLVKSSLESSGSDMTLDLATPLEIPGGTTASVAIRLDLSASTRATDFRVELLDSTSVSLVDPLSGAPVSARPTSAAFPFASALARIVSPATGLLVSTLPESAGAAGPGQSQQSLMTLRLVNPGAAGITSDVELLGLRVVLGDSAGAATRA